MIEIKEKKIAKRFRKLTHSTTIIKTVNISIKITLLTFPANEFTKSRPIRNKKEKFVEHSTLNNSKKLDKIVDELQYNHGDQDLAPYFEPLARAAGGQIQPPDISKLRLALRNKVLTVIILLFLYAF